MRWKTGRRSTNVEDRRGRRLPAARGMKFGGFGIIVFAVIAYFLGLNPLEILQVAVQDTTVSDPSVPPPSPPVNDEQADFTSVILADTEDTWADLFHRMNRTYSPPRLVLFSDAVHSACGLNSAAVGPFYCPTDSKVYLDLSFFQDLDERFGAPGDFAQAYVIAHEVGHHVQNILGISADVQQQRREMNPEESNALSVRQELQADCFAGVWAYYANRQRRMLEPGDLEEGLAAASAIGDDRLQRQSQGYVTPESWTHGSSRMRVSWFRQGFEQGDPGVCDTFEAASL